MKFGIRDLMLLVTLIAILLWLFSGNNKDVGRHILCALFVLACSVSSGLVFRHWNEIRLRCAIGGLVGACLYCLLSWILMDQFIDIPAIRRIKLSIADMTEMRYHIFTIEAMCLVPLAIAMGATVGPFLIFVLRNRKLNENDRTNRNISGVLLGLIVLAWLLGVIDEWNSNYLDSHWLGICGVLALIFVLFTFSWIGEYIKTVSKAALSVKGDTTTNSPDEVGELQSPETLD